MDFTKKEYKEMLKIHNQKYMDLVKWLYKNHLEIWRQFEKEKLHGVKLQMLEKNESGSEKDGNNKADGKQE